jgi:hypothetical protein
MEIKINLAIIILLLELNLFIINYLYKKKKKNLKKILARVWETYLLIIHKMKYNKKYPN